MTKPVSLFSQGGYRSDVWRVPEGSCWPSDHETGLFDNGRGPMAAGGKSRFTSTGPHNCTPAARSLALAEEIISTLHAINRKVGR